MIQFGGMVAFANTSLALLAVSILWLDPILLWLLALPARHRLPRLPGVRVGAREARAPRAAVPVDRGSSSTRRSSTPTLVALLGHARTMFRAELAEIVLYPRGADAATPCARRRGTTREPEVMVPIARARATTRSTRRVRRRHGRSSSMTRRSRREPHGPARHGQPAPRRVRADRLAADRQPAHRGHDLQRATTCASSRRSRTRPRSPSRTATSSSRSPSCRG